MSYVIRTSHGYVAGAHGHRRSFTSDKYAARQYLSRASAEAELRHGETIEEVIWLSP